MSFSPARRSLLASIFTLAASGSLARPKPNPKPNAKPKPTILAGAPFTLDAGRILLDVVFRTPDGGARRALAWFNMGMASPTLTKGLYRELGIDRGSPLQVELAGAVLEAPASAVANGDGGVGAPAFAHLFSPHPVEAMLPASLLRDHSLTLDYAGRALSLTPSGGSTPHGNAVPIAVNSETGLAAVDVATDGQTHRFVIDAGSGYNWMRGDVLKQWLAVHPDWRRAEGAIGLANANMLDYDFEKRGTVARAAELSIGGVTLKDAGLLGTGPILGAFVDRLAGDFFWDNWQKAAPGPVAGWLGANALKNFVLTIDYPARMSYWRAQSAPDPHDLDQPGVTLVRSGDRYLIGGIVRPAKGAALEGAALEGVSVGDELTGVGGLGARDASKQALLAALHGKPGETRVLILSRDGAERRVEAPVLDLS